MEIQVNRNKSMLDDICLGCVIVDDENNYYIVLQHQLDGYFEYFDIKNNITFGCYHDIEDLKYGLQNPIIKVIQPNKIKILIEEE